MDLPDRGLNNLVKQIIYSDLFDMDYEAVNLSVRGIFLRLVHSGFHAKRDRQPIPAVDCHNGHGQIHHFFFSEMLSDGFIHLVRSVCVRDKCDSFRPFKGRSLTFGKKRCFTPGG